jgi:peptidoglycan/LPS O-acetylase OafA/YrhL
MHFLDVIRGVAALSVVLQHVGDGSWPQFEWFTHHVFNVGKLGVTLFFLTSGFVIPLTLEAGNSLKKFWLSRVFRLYPLYWFSLAIGVAWMAIAHFTFTPGFTDHLVHNALVNLTMIQGAFGVPSCQELYYTLAIEMVLYAGISLLFLLGWHKRTYELVGLALILFAVATVLVPLLMHRRTPFAGIWLIMCFAFGMLMYRVYSGEVPLSKALPPLAVGLAVSAAGAYVNYVWLSKAEEPFTLWAIFLPGLLGIAAFLAMYLLRARPLPRAMVFVGTISYSIYLMNAFAEPFIPNGLPKVAKLVLNIAVTILISTATYYAIEKPFVKLGKHVQKRLLPAAEPALERA